MKPEQNVVLGESRHRETPLVGEEMRVRALAGWATRKCGTAGGSAAPGPLLLDSLRTAALRERATGRPDLDCEHQRRSDQSRRAN